MIRKILLIFGIATCTVFMSGCFPTYSTITYWGEIRGKVTTPDGEPLNNVIVIGSFCNISATSLTNESGEFTIKPLQHKYFIRYIGGIYPKSPNHDYVHNGYFDIDFILRQKHINHVVSWSVADFAKNKIPIYLLNRYQPYDNYVNMINPITNELVHTTKFIVPVYDEQITIEDEFVKITFDKSFTKQIKESEIY